MIVDFSPATGLTLVEADDFLRFKLRIRDDSGRLPDLPGVVLTDDSNALVSIDAVSRLPGAPDTQAWRAGFSKMVDYAATKGWIDSATNAIRAHVERVP
ncbi:MAG: hypothetical protein M9939_13090 [Mesorhizobium sp.]|nr:hypothetical protein [Mesorhizobium sp.]MCO5162068.1 hypothetical protein [Mesorhizobium sp.]